MNAGNSCSAITREKSLILLNFALHSDTGFPQNVDLFSVSAIESTMLQF